MASIREVPMTMEYCALITAGVEFGDTALGLSPPVNPHLVQSTIEEYLDGLRLGTSAGADEHSSAYLGLFWAMTVVQAFEWKWVAVMRGDRPGLGVTDPKQKYLALPIDFFLQLSKPDFDRSIPGPAERFEAIREGFMPPSHPGSFTVITD